MSSEFEDLQRDGKILAAQGKLFESLQKFEQAKKIKETPKILHRIQKLKDFIAANGYRENTNDGIEDELGSSTFQKHAKLGSIGENISKHQKTSQELVAAKDTTKVLNQIENIEPAQKFSSEKQHDLVNLNNSKLSSGLMKISSPSKKSELLKQHIPENPNDLSPEDLKQFNKLKKTAMELLYVGNFVDSMEKFSKALELCACPKVKKYYQDIKLMASQHAEKLHEVQNLANTGKKLAIDGNQVEALKKLKDAFAVCPSPSISKMIKTLEPQNLFKCPSEKGPIPFELTDNSSGSKTETTSESDNSENTTSICNDPTALSPEKLAKFKFLYEKARIDAGEGKLQEALKALLDAKSICASNKLLKRITALQEHIKTSAVNNGESDEMVAVADGFYIFHEIYEKLYPYQRVGVAWMWKLFKAQKGGILGDDMGLGKTFQVIAFLSGLIDADKLKHVIIIMPVSLLPNWEKEFKKWCPGIHVSVFHSGSKKEKERSILRVQRRGHVLLTSYGMVISNLDSLTQFDGREFVWDYVILDEGHKIKNPTKTTKAVHEIPSKNRLVLTGTPIQNNLRELWALYDFTHQGTLLGSMKTFKMTYEAIITRAREKDATSGEKRLGTEMADNLKKLISPYFLRRTKAEVYNNANQSDATDLDDKMKNLNIHENKLGRKNDLIMWVYLSEPQCEIYQNFLHSDAVKTILLSKRSPLVELTILKKICDHPRLLSRRACLQLGLNGQLSEDDLTRELDDESSYASSIENVSDETLITESGKMKFLISLLENLKGNGHRTLVFSLSRKILDMVHRILLNRNWKVMRIDGTISKIEERERRIQLFQKDSSYSVFLLTTQVGGVGITLTAADRVIIYDPSWNPATDAQAVDRVYRIGQQKNVVVYRLITCGSVEEKIYRRQVFKDSITRQATGSTDPYRYFSKQELRELFSLDNPHHSATQAQLSEMHSDGRQSDTRLDEHIAFLHSLNIFGVSDHDLMFSKSAVDHSEDNDETAVSHDFIKKQVLMAQARIQDEAAVVEEGIRLAGSYSRPFSEPIKVFKSNLNKDSYKPPTLSEVTEVGDKSPIASLNGMQQQSIQSSGRKSNTDKCTLVPEKEKITFHFSKNVSSNKENSSLPFETSNTDLPVFSPKRLSTCKSSLSIAISSVESDSPDKLDLAKSIEKEYFPENTVEVNSSQLDAENLSEHIYSEDDLPPGKEYSIHDITSPNLTSTPRSKIIPSKDKDNTSSSLHGQFEDIVDIETEKSFSEEFVSNQKDYSIISKSSDDIVPHESILELEGSTIAGNFDAEVLKLSQKQGHSLLAESTEVPINLNEDLHMDENIEHNIKIEPLLESDIERISDDIPAKTISNSNAFSEYRLSTTIDVLDSAEEDDLPVNSSIPASPNKSLFQDNFETSSPTSENNFDFRKVSAYENSSILADLSFDEKPILKNSRKSCARQEFVCDSDSSNKTSCPSSVNNSDDEVPESEDDGVNITADSTRSDILDTSLVVPSSIPNSPFSSNAIRLNRSLALSKRITPLRLRKSYVLPIRSAFALALAQSPVLESENFQSADISKSNLMDSTSEIDSPVIMQKKKKNIIVSESEDDTEEEKQSDEDY